MVVENTSTAKVVETSKDIKAIKAMIVLGKAMSNE